MVEEFGLLLIGWKLYEMEDTGSCRVFGGGERDALSKLLLKTSWGEGTVH
jgi:hypothetical protein